MTCNPQLGAGSPRRVALLIDNMEIGGAQKLLQIQVEKMSATHRLLVVSLSHDTPLSQELAAAGAEVLSVGLPGLFHVPTLLKLRRDLGRWRPDLIHSHLTYALIVGSTMSTWLRLPHVTTLHSDRFEGNSVTDRVRRHLASFVLRHRTDLVIACGPRVAHSQQGQVGRTPLVSIRNRVRPISPIAARDRADARVALGVRLEDLVFLAAGRLVPLKGFDVLLEAFSRAAKSEDRSRLLVAGEGPDRRALQEQAKGLGLEGRVRFLGPVDDLGPYMSMADAFVLSSRFEGLPLVLLEALAAGCPVIATRVGDVETVLGEGTGLLVAAGEAEPLATAILRLSGDADLRVRLAAASLEASRPYTDLATFQAELEGAYARVTQLHAQRA
jgi:glycosyltransferase involved in cell wall biosynthesis